MLITKRYLKVTETDRVQEYKRGNQQTTRLNSDWKKVQPLHSCVPKDLSILF